MNPPTESIVAEGRPATGRMEIVDRSVDPSALARAIAVLER